MPIYFGSLRNERDLSGNLETLLRWDADLFANFFLPEGLDVPTAIRCIRRRHGTAPLYRPDPVWMKSELYWFCRERQEIWRKLYATTVLDYNPIWNTDAVTRTTDKEHGRRQTTEDEQGWSAGRSKSGSEADTYGHTDERRDGQHQTATEQAEHSDATKHGDTYGHTDTRAGSISQKDMEQAERTDAISHATEASQTDTTGHMDTTGKSVTDDTRHTDTSGNEIFAGDVHTTTTDHVTEHSETKTNLSPENAADYQPDTQTITDTTKDANGTSNTITANTTNRTGDEDTTGHSQTDTTGSQDTTGQTKAASDAWNTSKGDRHAEGAERATTDERSEQDMRGHTEDAEQSKRHAAGSEYGTTGERAEGDSRQNYIDKAHAEQHAEDGRTQLGREHYDAEHENVVIRQGNIGVTSTQQLIEAEREVAIFNVYAAIADDFHHEFCLDIYAIF